MTDSVEQWEENDSVDYSDWCAALLVCDDPNVGRYREVVYAASFNELFVEASNSINEFLEPYINLVSGMIPRRHLHEMYDLTFGHDQDDDNPSVVTKNDYTFVDYESLIIESAKKTIAESENDPLESVIETFWHQEIQVVNELIRPNSWKEPDLWLEVAIEGYLPNFVTSLHEHVLEGSFPLGDYRQPYTGQEEIIGRLALLKDLHEETWIGKGCHTYQYFQDTIQKFNKLNQL